jgi:gliding motility-associated lipoprotein GldH
MNKGRMLIICIASGLVALVTSSCQSPQVYEKYAKIPDYIWTYNHVVPFEFSIADTNARYNIYLNIRIAGTYPYSNIWISGTRQDANGTLSKKRYEFILAYPDGKWTGSGLGDIIDNRFLMEEGIKFSLIGDYRYSFHHDMRVENLPSVIDVGIEVEKMAN